MEPRRLKKHIGGLSGFTLLELLIVLGILSVVVTSTLVFLTAILRGSNKTNITSEVKQNGQAALESLERQIRNSKDAFQLSPFSPPYTLPAGASNGAVFNLISGEDLFVACFPASAAANGWIGVAKAAKDAVPTAGDYTPLTNRDFISGVDVQCHPSSPPYNFLVTPKSGPGPAYVSIVFTIRQGAGAPSRQDFVIEEKFQTTISLRAY